MNQFWGSVVTVATAVIGLAIVAVLVSNNAQTAGVISSATQGFSGILTAAEGPVSGNFGSNLHLPGYNG